MSQSGEVFLCVCDRSRRSVCWKQLFVVIRTVNFVVLQQTVLNNNCLLYLLSFVEQINHLRDREIATQQMRISCNTFQFKTQSSN